MLDWLLLGLRILAPLLIYSFLGLLIYRLWQVRRVASPAEMVLFRLDDLSTKPIQLGWQNTLGRQASNSIILPDETISAQHARLILAEGRWWLFDLDSTNGTFLNETPVKGQTALRPGDVLRLGRYRFRLIRRVDVPATPAINLPDDPDSAASTTRPTSSPSSSATL